MLKEKHILTGFVAVALLIGVAEWLTPVGNEETHVVITPEFKQFVATQAAEARKTNPSLQFDDAMASAIEEEILYREGKHLGLDDNDLIVKRRVVQKMRFLLEASTPLDEPSEAQLQAWLDDHPEQFLTEGSVVMQHVFFAREHSESGSLAKAQQVSLLLAEPVQNSQSTLGDPHPLSNQAAPIGYRQLLRELGKSTADQIMALPLNEWSTPLRSAVGAHVVKVHERQTPIQQTIEQAGEPLVATVRQAQREFMNQAALAALQSRYQVIDIAEQSTKEKLK